MKKLLFLLFACASMAFGSDYESSFKAWIVDEKMEQADSILKLWEQEAPDDPRLYKARFVYYLSKGIDAGPDKSDSLFDVAFENIDKGIERYPDILSLRTDKAEGAMTAGRRSALADAVDGMLSRTKENSAGWNCEVDSLPADSVLPHIREVSNYCISELYGADDDENARNDVERLGRLFLEIFPGDKEMLTLLSAVSYARENYAEAMSYLKQALASNPEEDIIRFNMALISAQTGDTDKALDYCKMIENSPHAEASLKSEASALAERISRPVQEMTKYQFCFQWLPVWAAATEVGSDNESALADPNFFNTIVPYNRGLRSPYKDSDFSVKIVEVDGKKIYVWKFPEPDEAPLPLYEAFIPVDGYFKPYILEKSVFVDWMIGTSDRKTHTSFGDAPRPKDAEDFVKILKERGAFEGKIKPGSFMSRPANDL